MINDTQNKIYKYTQIFDYLQNTGLNDYINDKRNFIHSDVYKYALDSLIYDVQELQEIEIIKEDNKYIFSTDIYISDIAREIAIILYENNIEPKDFNEDNFKFIEYKDNNWSMPSKVLIIYTANNIKHIKKKEDGTEIEYYGKLKIGPLSLYEYWETTYIDSKTMNLLLNRRNYILKYIDYVNNTCILLNKNTQKEEIYNISFIEDLWSFDMDDIYNQTFGAKKYTPVI